MDLKNLEYKSTRDGYGAALVELGEAKDNVVVLSADLSPSTMVGKFRDRFPNRFFEVGISEQDMVGIASGLSYTGKIPFVSSFGVFAPGNCYGQVRLSVAFSKANVKIGGSHCGINIGEDGGSAQIIEDIALTRVLPNFTVLVPCDYYETKKAVHKAADINGPVYIRFSRNKWPVITSAESYFEVGKMNVLREGKDVSVIACGLMVYNALIAAEKLKKEKIDVRVINCHTVKPIDKSIINAAKATGAIVTAEDHNVMGGLGSAVAELLAENYPVPMKFVGVRDIFGQSGSPDELMAEYGLNPDSIIRSVREIISQKS